MEQNRGAFLAGFLLMLAVGLVIGTVVGAIVLRAAISLYHWFIGGKDSPQAVPEPSFGKAMGITLAIAVANVMAGLMVGVFFGSVDQFAGRGGGGQPRGDVAMGQVLSTLISIPLGFFIEAGMISTYLPTTFRRAALITLCHFLIAVCVGILFLAVGYVIVVMTK